MLGYRSLTEPNKPKKTALFGLPVGFTVYRTGFAGFENRYCCGF
jgi:hypothetical protein